MLAKQRQARQAASVRTTQRRGPLNVIKRYGMGTPAQAAAVLRRVPGAILQLGVQAFFKEPKKPQFEFQLKKKSADLWPTLVRVASVAGAATVLAPVAQWLAVSTRSNLLLSSAGWLPATVFALHKLVDYFSPDKTDVDPAYLQARLDVLATVLNSPHLSSAMLAPFARSNNNLPPNDVMAFHESFNFLSSEPNDQHALKGLETQYLAQIVARRAVPVSELNLLHETPYKHYEVIQRDAKPSYKRVDLFRNVAGLSAQLHGLPNMENAEQPAINDWDRQRARRSAQAAHFQFKQLPFIKAAATAVGACSPLLIWLASTVFNPKLGYGRLLSNQEQYLRYKHDADTHGWARKTSAHNILFAYNLNKNVPLGWVSPFWNVSSALVSPISTMVEDWFFRIVVPKRLQEAQLGFWKSSFLSGFFAGVMSAVTMKNIFQGDLTRGRIFQVLNAIAAAPVLNAVVANTPDFLQYPVMGITRALIEHSNNLSRHVVDGIDDFRGPHGLAGLVSWLAMDALLLLGQSRVLLPQYSPLAYPELPKRIVQA